MTDEGGGLLADEMLADFQQYYGLDLGELMLHGEFSRAVALASQLPARSRLVTSMHPELAWDEQTYILAGVHDTLANIAHGLGGGKGAKPKPIPRPKPKPKKKRHKRLDVSRANVAALLFGARKQPEPTDGEGETTEEGE